MAGPLQGAQCGTNDVAERGRIKCFMLHFHCAGKFSDFLIIISMQRGLARLQSLFQFPVGILRHVLQNQAKREQRAGSLIDRCVKVRGERILGAE